jgi:hypothetical protein
MIEAARSVLRNVYNRNVYHTLLMVCLVIVLVGTGMVATGDDNVTNQLKTAMPVMTSIGFILSFIALFVDWNSPKPY